MSVSTKNRALPRPGNGRLPAGRALPLCFWADHWVPVPDWARFFIDLGAAMASINPGQSRVVAAVSTPTRAFAAALCAIGIVRDRLATPVVPDVTEHLAHLRALPLNTTVIFRPGTSGTKQKIGQLVGWDTRYGRDYLVIRDSRNSSHLMPADRALAVRVAERQRTAPPASPTLRPVQEDPGLLAGVLSDDALAECLRHSRLECLLVGNETTLRQELLTAPFATSGECGLVEGCLQDIARVHGLGRDGESHRSEIVSATRGPTRRLAVIWPPVVIFDGSTSFLRWGSAWPGANRVIILDRTDHRFTEAVAEVDAAYATRAGDAASRALPVPPPGIECAAFETRRGMT